MHPRLRTIRSRLASRPARIPLATLEAALWLVGALGIGAALYSWIDAATFRRAGLAQLAEQSAETASDPAPIPGEAIAEIEIQRLELSAVVAEGTDEAVLRRAVGHLSTSSLPGEAGNIVLAGHRDTLFRPLAKIEPGDIVVLREPGAEHRYEVEWVRVVQPTAIEVLDATPDASLTLITCYPFRYIGPAPQRFVVRARNVS